MIVLIELLQTSASITTRPQPPQTPCIRQFTAVSTAVPSLAGLCAITFVGAQSTREPVHIAATLQVVGCDIVSGLFELTACLTCRSSIESLVQGVHQLTEVGACKMSPPVIHVRPDLQLI